MSQKLPNEGQQEELSWEEAVLKYLEDNPEFFINNPSILTHINIPHTGSGAAISLIEHQVQVLREKNKDLTHQLQNLISIARENDTLGRQLHQFAIAMIDSFSLDDVLDAARTTLQQEYRLEYIALLFHSQAKVASGRPEFALSGDAKFADLLNQITKNNMLNKPMRCNSKHENILIDLFGERALEVKSCIIIPLGGSPPDGVLALGSDALDRFYPSMGTAYLKKFGEILYRSVAAYLN